MHSNAYTFRFIIILTGLAAMLLSLAATKLKPLQDFNREIETKKNILIAVDIYKEGMKATDIETSYDSNILEKYIDETGGYSADDSGKPVFLYGGAENPEGYIFPISGKGLWSTVNGFFALESDLNTVKGITFYEHGETPGLGGEIEKTWFTAQFKGKKVFNTSGSLVSVMIAKGKAIKADDHNVDGISGATLTTKGVNDFILADLQSYEQYIRKFK